MFICEIWLLDWYFPQFWKSDMSKYGYLEVFQRAFGKKSKREVCEGLGIQQVCKQNVFRSKLSV